MNFPLYTLVQDFTFTKKADNSMKNNAKATSTTSNNSSFFALPVCNSNFKVLL